MKTFAFTLDQNDVMVLSEALGNVPYKIAAPVIAKLQAQINEQEQPTKPTLVEADNDKAAS